MGNYEVLKQAVSDVIKTNGNQEITGQIMQNVLLSIINNVGKYATYVGVATLKTNPGTPDQNVFYLASENGVYPNFGVTLDNEIAVISNNNGSWEKKLLLKIDKELNVQSENPVENKAVSMKMAKLETKIAEQKNEVDAAKQEALNAIDEAEQNALDNFSEQRVTPEMLSEATLQLIETAGGVLLTIYPTMKI